jgi:hypothetical protein
VKKHWFNPLFECPLSGSAPDRDRTPVDVLTYDAGLKISKKFMRAIIERPPTQGVSNPPPGGVQGRKEFFGTYPTTTYFCNFLVKLTRRIEMTDNPLIYYHGTTATNAQSILKEGFRDATGGYMLDGVTLTGVFLSDRPLDENEGACSEVMLRVTFASKPSNFDEFIEIEEDGKPYREWCVSAKLINGVAKIEILE